MSVILYAVVFLVSFVLALRAVWLFRKNEDPIKFISLRSIKKSWYEDYLDHKSRIEDVLNYA